MLQDSRSLPTWDLSSIYPGLDSDQFRRDFQNLQSGIQALEARLSHPPTHDPGHWLVSFLRDAEETLSLLEELSAFVRVLYSVDTRSEDVLKKLHAVQDAGLPLQRIWTRFRNVLASLAEDLDGLIAQDPFLREREFFLREELFYQRHQMSEAEEDLAADLSRAGADAWSRLQQSVSSTARATWDEATGETKTLNELRNLAHSPDREVRRKAFERELEVLASWEIPFAFALNGVKGFSLSLDRRRSYRDPLEKAIVQARITPKALDALVGAMEESLPLFRRYLRGKARLLGLDQLAFFDLFAPVGEGVRPWPFEEASAFIVDLFADFSDELASFARHAFQRRWIDALPREGKVGGAYCAGFVRSKESRILCNYDGSFNAVTTLAHELGHGYHHFVLKDAPLPHHAYPMTLAETASIFAEQLVFTGALHAASSQERLTLLEGFLQNATQAIVDILSRFKFERSVFERRTSSELSPRELCDLMRDCQRATYGDGLDERWLHPYMWAVKPHYYRAELSFYNFPYAFGLLFGLGLYALFLDQGRPFVPRYKDLLASTGKANAVDVVRAVGFEIEDPSFWRWGIQLIRQHVDEFLSLVPGPSGGEEGRVA